jgi:hypothetical protein
MELLGRFAGARTPSTPTITSTTTAERPEGAT